MSNRNDWNQQIIAEFRANGGKVSGQFAGRTLLLYADQGYGDTIQFIRYAPLVKERGGTLIVECQAPLMRLLSGVLAGQEGEFTLTGDESLTPRPMERVAAPLRRMGAEVETTEGHAPLVVRGRVTHRLGCTGSISAGTGYKVSDR